MRKQFEEALDLMKQLADNVVRLGNRVKKNEEEIKELKKIINTRN